MILVDTSVWIELINKKQKNYPDLEQLRQIATCAPIIQEVVQGVAEQASQGRILRAMLAFQRYSDPVPMELYLKAAEIYSMGRRKGYTIRSSIDCLIAAVAIENQLGLWHKDRDFDVIAKFTNLKIVAGFTE